MAMRHQVSSRVDNAIFEYIESNIKPDVPVLNYWSGLNSNSSILEDRGYTVYSHDLPQAIFTNHHRECMAYTYDVVVNFRY